MRKLLLFAVAFLASVSTFAQGEGKLVADTITLAPSSNESYRMFVLNYSDSALAAKAEGAKFAVKFASENPEIVKPDGYWFYALTPGECDVTFRMSRTYPGQNDLFDEKSLVMEKKFHVIVKEDAQTVVPSIEMSWGLSREDAIKKQETDPQFGNECITDHYLSNNQKIVDNNPDYAKQIEVFNNDNFEFPITISQFNTADNELVANTYLMSSWEKAYIPNISFMYKWLKKRGFEEGVGEGIWKLFYDFHGMITDVEPEAIVYDNVMFVALTFTYGGGTVDAGIDNATEFPEVDITTSGNTITLVAGNYAGHNVVLSDLSGKVLCETEISNASNVFTVPGHGMYVLKIDGYRAIKVVL